MLSPGYGGGTANIEYQEITGMSLSNFSDSMTVPYQQLVQTRRTHMLSTRFGHNVMARNPLAQYIHMLRTCTCAMLIIRNLVLTTYIPTIVRYELPTKTISTVIRTSATARLIRISSISSKDDKSGTPQFLQLVTMQKSHAL